VTPPADRSRGEPCAYLPDLCAPTAVLAVVLIAELVAIALTLSRQEQWVSFFSDLGRTSFVMQWLSLTSAAVLCLLRPLAAHLPLRPGSALAFTAVLANLTLVSEALYWIGYSVAPGAAGRWLPADHWTFLARNLTLGGIVAGGLLRYCYVSSQWQQNVRREAEARLHALQARIRPHFLFNSMNTIASLIRSHPAAAEQSVEDLADLFRASLADARAQVPLGEELEIARVYERMEQLRLGERLQVRWDLDPLPVDAMIPGLTIQPLIENAIYHGIERLPGPGVVEVSGHRDEDMLYITVKNPTAPSSDVTRSGSQIALQNIRERLELAFGERAGLSIASEPAEFRATLAFPYRKA
jgi:two-component system sensor histidine kinase AlgZ